MNLVKALRFYALSAILSLSLPAVTCVVVMVALVNNNFQYKLIKLFVASTGFHTSIKNLCESLIFFGC